MESGVVFLDEFLQLLCIDVADGKEFQTLCGPAPNVESLHRLIRPMMFRARTLRDEEIDHMRSAPIDDRSDGSPANIVEPPTDQPEALRRQIHDRRRDIDLAAEPWFHGVLVARLHVGEVLALKRAHMCRDDVAEQRAGPDPFE